MTVKQLILPNKEDQSWWANTIQCYRETLTAVGKFDTMIRALSPSSHLHDQTSRFKLPKREEKTIGCRAGCACIPSPDPREALVLHQVTVIQSLWPQVTSSVPGFLVPRPPHVSSSVPGFLVPWPPHVSSSVPGFLVPRPPHVSSSVPGFLVPRPPHVSSCAGVSSSAASPRLVLCAGISGSVASPRRIILDRTLIYIPKEDYLDKYNQGKDHSDIRIGPWRNRSMEEQVSKGNGEEEVMRMTLRSFLSPPPELPAGMGLKCDNDDGYTFRLSQLDESVYSDTGTVSSTYKQRIDSLFRDKRRQDSQLHFNNTRPSPEIERMFGGRDERQRAFHDVRSAVQAQIERLFADATSDPNTTNNLKRTHPTKTPPLPVRSAEPPPPVPIIPPPLHLKEVSLTSSAVTAPVPAPQRYRHCESPPPAPNGRGSVSGSSVWSTGGTSRSSLSPSSDGGSVKSSASAATGTRPPSSSSSTSSSASSPVSTPHAPSAMKYRVDYLGALQLAERATSLNVLQVPLKDMYYKYRFGISKGHKPHSSTLQITEAGLKIANGPNGSDLVNPFPTIAVWAAVKLVIRKEMGERGHVVHTYAFLPLICDPEAQDKYSLYHPLNVTDPNVMAGMTHPPMFACVMRKVGVPKVLECHGFVCQSAEDAIVIAANLYQALLENMKTEVTNELSDPRDDERTVMSDSEMAPVRPPRRKRSSSTSNNHLERGKDSPRLRRANSEDLLQTHIIMEDPIRMSKRRLKRSISDRNFSGTFLGDSGDVYTKVALPRSKSFMNVTNKYNFQDLIDDVKRKTGLKSVDDLLKQVINPKGMSFSEMDPDQREILLKLALTLSKDEIYQRSKSILRKQRGRTTSVMSLIDSDSDSSTISSVLRATKRSFSRLGSRASSLQSSYLKDKSPLRRLVSSKKGYSFERVHQDNSRDRENDFSHFLEQGGSGTSKGRKMPKTPMPKRSSSHSEQSYLSCSECGYDSECSSKCYCSLPPRRSSPSSRSHRSVTSSQSSSVNNNRKGNHDHSGVLHQNGTMNNNPCECDTESCAESEKCYCSLKRVKKDGLKMYEINLDSETDTNTATTGRSSDYKRHYGSQSNLSDVGSQMTSWQRMPNTGGSSSSANRNKSSASFLTEQSKSRSAGTVFSLHPEAMRKKSLSSNLSSDSEASVLQQRTSSGGSGYHSQDSGRRRESGLHTGSTESLLNSPRLRRHPSGSMGSGGSRGSRGSGDSRGSSSDGIVIGNGSQRSRESRGSHVSSSSQQKILLVSAVDPSGKVVYRGASQKQQREGSDTASILSMKKTAEIAALFSELKLNQTTDLIDHFNVSASESEDDAYSSMQANNSFLFSDSNIENSLGYLP
ncbi:uncharacterized protein LOC143020136 [Oratosquilla oratoria]|uniref:uncharacterized protein LOC143020136 n=1 Tax=Oratosquilla oratoria TaxID=337810 RepID=UPI003F7576D2